MRNPRYFPLVVKYIGELRAEVREKYGINFEKHVAELAKIRNDALKNKAWSAAVNAEVARGKAGGLYVDQKLVMTGNIDNLSADEIKDKLKKILDDNKEIINITPEDIKLEELELPTKSAPESD
jgi:predicted TIM-barrel enzyme